MTEPAGSVTGRLNTYGDCHCCEKFRIHNNGSVQPSGRRARNSIERPPALIWTRTPRSLRNAGNVCSVCTRPLVSRRRATSGFSTMSLVVRTGPSGVYKTKFSARARFQCSGLTDQINGNAAAHRAL